MIILNYSLKAVLYTILKRVKVEASTSLGQAQQNTRSFTFHGINTLISICELEEYLFMKKAQNICNYIDSCNVVLCWVEIDCSHLYINPNKPHFVTSSILPLEKHAQQ